MSCEDVDTCWEPQFYPILTVYLLMILVWVSIEAEIETKMPGLQVSLWVTLKLLTGEEVT